MRGIKLCEVEIGKYTDSGAILQDLEDAGYGWCDWGADILGKVRLDGVRRSILLFLLTNEDLGLPEGADYRDIIHPERTTLGKALAAGFKTCSGEGGPALLLQHSRDSEDMVGDGLAVGMDVLAANCSWSSILALRKKRPDVSRPILSATRAVWHPPKHRFLFTC